MPVAAGRLVPRAMACRQPDSWSATAWVMASTSARFLRDDDEAAGVAADYVPGTDGHPAALHDDVDRTRSLVRSGRGMGAHGERRQAGRVETVEVADGAVDDQPVAAEVGESLAGDVADHRRVRPAAAVDDQHVAGRDQVRRLQHVQDVTGLGPHGHRRAAQLPAVGQVTQRRAHDRDRTTAVGDLRRGALPQRGHQRPLRAFRDLADCPLLGMGLAHLCLLGNRPWCREGRRRHTSHRWPSR
jgi:hypothetical protein